MQHISEEFNELSLNKNSEPILMQRKSPIQIFIDKVNAQEMTHRARLAKSVRWSVQSRILRDTRTEKEMYLAALQAPRIRVTLLIQLNKTRQNTDNILKGPIRSTISQMTLKEVGKNSRWSHNNGILGLPTPRTPI